MNAVEADRRAIARLCRLSIALSIGAVISAAASISFAVWSHAHDVCQ